SSTPTAAWLWKRKLRFCKRQAGRHGLHRWDVASPRRWAPNGLMCRSFFRNRSRVEGDKRMVPETHWERQEAQHFGGNDQEETWRDSSTRSAVQTANISASSTLVMRSGYDPHQPVAALRATEPN